MKQHQSALSRLSRLNEKREKKKNKKKPLFHSPPGSYMTSSAHESQHKETHLLDHPLPHAHPNTSQHKKNLFPELPRIAICTLQSEGPQLFQL
jgi:hypothetical protein